LAVRSEMLGAKLGRVKPILDDPRSRRRKSLSNYFFGPLPKTLVSTATHAALGSLYTKSSLQGSHASSSPSPSASPLPDILPISNPQRNRKCALPADLPVGPGKVGPWRV